MLSPDGVLRALTTGRAGLLVYAAIEEALRQALGADIARAWLDGVAAHTVAEEFAAHMVDGCPPPPPDKP